MHRNIWSRSIFTILFVIQTLGVWVWKAFQILTQNAGRIAASNVRYMCWRCLELDKRQTSANFSLLQKAEGECCCSSSSLMLLLLSVIFLRLLCNFSLLSSYQFYYLNMFLWQTKLKVIVNTEGSPCMNLCFAFGIPSPSFILLEIRGLYMKDVLQCVCYVCTWYENIKKQQLIKLLLMNEASGIRVNLLWSRLKENPYKL